MTLVRDLMTTDPTSVSPGATLDQIAAQMRDADTGFIPIVEDGRLVGAVTDRDIVVRAVADGKAPQDCRAEDVATTGLTSVSPDDDATDAAKQMRQADVRRLAVVEEDRLVGVISIGDLAIEKDEDSALADISAAAPDQ